jgi:ribosome-associated protein
MREFILDSEYIELVKLLKHLGIAETGGHAKMMVEAGEVLLNGKTEFRKRAKLRPNDIVETSGIKIRITAPEPGE